MASVRFNTISSDLQALAEAVFHHYRGLGYVVKVEPTDIELPYSPALRCKRGQTTVIVEVGKEEALARVQQWISFCRSAGKDMQLCLVFPASYEIKESVRTNLADLGVGILKESGKLLANVLPSSDLAINVELPKLSDCNQRARTLLGPAYEKFSRKDWRVGFEEACLALESLSRSNLKKGIAAGRISLMGKMKPLILSHLEIDKGTMGKLSLWYSMIVSPRQIESVLGKALKAVFKDRNKIIHRKHTSSTEKTVRARVGTHMWTIVNAIRIATS
ncbi:MAG: hypothetical protein WEB58_07110 [Planctomycetaceae bacterium]